jgi:hypothetical protein
MSKPEIHAASSVRRFGGAIEDYLPIHQLFDSSKSALGDNRHRALTHNTWFIAPNGPLERIFGVSFVNSAGRTVQVRDIGEQHIAEDFGGKYIPTAQDWLEQIPMQEWMNNGRRGVPPSVEHIADGRETTVRKVGRLDND